MSATFRWKQAFRPPAHRWAGERLAMLLLFATIVAWFFPRTAVALDRNFAGSAQIDYHFVPSSAASGTPRKVFDGATLEAALKLSVDVSDHLSANVKLCVGCHGLETDMAYLDYRFADEFNIRAGRFSPSFGAFNLRHDPANHRLSDKPLAYDMGRMLRLRDWNMGVLPSPFPDNGIELNGTHWFGTKLQFDYAAYAVSGFKGETGAADIDFLQSRTGNLYYVDNNGRPTVGARLAATARLAKTTDVTLGASGMYGTVDPKNELDYAIVGADLGFRFGKTNLRFEYLARREKLDVSEPGRFKYAIEPNGNYFVKHGGFGEIEIPASKVVDLLGRFDFLYRDGNVLTGSALQARSAVVRYTVGTAVTIERNLRAKFSTEFWSFSDVDSAGRHNAVSAHAGLVGTF